MRFDGFDDEWIEEKLGNLVQIKSGECTKNLITGIDNSIPYFKVEQLNNSLKYQIKTPYFINDKSKIVNKGSIIFPKRGAAILLNKIRILNQDSFMDTNLMTLTPNNKLYNEFLYYFIYKENLSKIADTTSIPQLNNKHIKPYPIKLPSFEEQLKISKFISSVDKKVALLSQNLEIFNDFKKGLLQQIFTQKLRFDFSDEWNYVNFNNIFKSASTKKYQIKSAEIMANGDFEVIDQGKDEIAGYFNDKNKLCYELPIIIYGDHTTFVKFRDKPFIVGADGVKLLLPKIDSNLKYLFYALEYFNIKPEGYKRHFSIIKKIKLPILSLEEQNEISEMFSSVDNKLKYTQKQLQETKKFKKGLLQQMFVVRINWRCNFKLAKSPSFNKHLLILKNKIIFIIIK